MASCMTAPSHYLKQCRYIIKLINNIPWHTSHIIKDLKIPISKMRLELECWDNFTPSPQIIQLFINDNSFVCVMVIADIYCHNLLSFWPLSIQGEQGTLPMCLLWPHHRGQCTKNTCCMKSQSHERLWPPLLKLKFGNGWLTSNCCGSSSKKFNSSFQFQFQFQFQGFQFQFHFQFHQFQFQFQFQFRNWNWNWAAIPIPELNWPQPCVCVWHAQRTLQETERLRWLSCVRIGYCYGNGVIQYSTGP